MPPIHVEQSLSFLLIQICKAHRSTAEQNLNCIGLHAGQEMFMMQLWEEDGQTQSQLAERLGVQPPTVNKMLSRMEASGLVMRRMDAEDNRVSRVYLTEASREKQREVEEAWAQLEQRTLANLTLDERVVLRRLLLQVHANLTGSE
jgi:MarR family transcriptional regulator, organic hydroperoxide resistance regulator